MDLAMLKKMISFSFENEGVEFKMNWQRADDISIYISALSNSAAEEGRKFGYLVWGVQDKTHQILGTSFDPNGDFENEPLKHYLERNLSPMLAIVFQTFEINGHTLVTLTIPAALRIPTSFKKIRYIRIGSSRERLDRYPEHEANLLIKLREGFPTIINTPSPKQDLTFSQLKLYYATKGLILKENTFWEELSFYLEGTTQYNELAYLMADKNNVVIRASVFAGKDKADNLVSLNEFGHQCLLLSIEGLFNYGEAINFMQVNEKEANLTRKETPQFDPKCFREAILNAFIHNDWEGLEGPMIFLFSDRIEILSYGGVFLPDRL
jgi:ATP-dependent DNA helicase RecG